jgi:Fic family protein
MKVRKTIRAKILELRKGKEELLKREYENFQRYLHGDKSVPLYSATKQQADRFLKRIGKPKEGKGVSDDSQKRCLQSLYEADAVLA